MPRGVGDWTLDKLKILELYLPGYLQATKRARQRYYVDAFAGPGKNLLRSSRRIIDGSPLIALKSEAQNGTRFSRYFFIDQDREAIHELTEHVKQLDMLDRCEIITGDVNERLPEVMRQIHPLAPTFVFLDTDAIEPRWSTVHRISPWKVEFLINFPLGMSIKRNQESQKTVDYFGTEDCLPFLRRAASGDDRALLDIYKKQLVSVGLTYSPDDDRLVKTDGNVALYYLVHASKVPEARKIMDWALKQPDAKGQQRFLI